MTERGHLTGEQIEVLLRPVKPDRVNKTPQGMSHLEAYDVIAHLTRMFGFEGWDKEILSLDLLFEDGVVDGTRTKWTVGYRCSMRLTVYDQRGQIVKTTEDVSTGDAINQPSRGDAHDLAVKAAVSGALKRCAKDLGDQFGLGLYDKGSLDPTVKRVVGRQVSEPAVPSPSHGAEEPPPSDAGASEHGGGPPVSELLTQANGAAIFAACRERKMDPHGAVHEALGHPIESINDLTREEGHKALTWIRNQPIPVTQGAST